MAALDGTLFAIGGRRPAQTGNVPVLALTLATTFFVHRQLGLEVGR